MRQSAMVIIKRAANTVVYSVAVKSQKRGVINNNFFLRLAFF
jgi:hypothetical protein